MTILCMAVYTKVHTSVCTQCVYTSLCVAVYTTLHCDGECDSNLPISEHECQTAKTRPCEAIEFSVLMAKNLNTHMPQPTDPIIYI